MRLSAGVLLPLKPLGEQNTAHHQDDVNHFGNPLANNNPPAEVSTPTNYHNDEDLFASALASSRELDAPGSAFLTPGHAYDFDASPEPCPTKPGIVLAPNHPSNELETLRQALSHAHRQINTLKSTVQREKEQKLQFKKQLAKEGLLNASVPGAWEDEEVDEDDVEKSPSAPLLPLVAGIVQPADAEPRSFKLGLASVERHAASNGDWEGAPSPPTSPPGNDLLDEEVEGGHDEPGEPSPFVVPSRPTSVDGMAFANVLKQMPGGSHLRPSPLAGQRDPVSPSPQPAATGKKSRGGSAFKRPTSLAGPPASSPGAELELEEEMPTIVVAKETSEMSTQTDPEEPPAPIKEIVKEVVKEIVTVEVPVRVEVPNPSQSQRQPSSTYAEEGVATDSEPETVLPPRKVMAKADVQTDVEPEEIEIPIQSAGPVADVELRSMVISREEVELPSNRVTVPFPIRTTELGAEVVTDDDTTMPARTPRILSMASTRTARPVDMIFEDADAETETDGEFLDARESMVAMTPTPADWLSDFHSAHDGPVPSESEHSDAESIRTLRIAVQERYASLTAQGRCISQTSRTIPIVQPAPPKPELKDEGIQTDEWSFLPVPPSPAKSFHCVGTICTAIVNSVDAAPIAPEDGPGVTRSQILTVPTPPVDRTKPPVMMMPPPPPMPPSSSIPVRTKTPSGGPPLTQRHRLR
ncbi:hypothetical protein FRC00_014329 [Tulasnella sp. 408]|nr:hypothetical protein FRC00_014329 [Tulasnella sp. 408]